MLWLACKYFPQNKEIFHLFYFLFYIIFMCFFHRLLSSRFYSQLFRLCISHEQQQQQREIYDEKMSEIIWQANIFVGSEKLKSSISRQRSFLCVCVRFIKPQFFMS
jgi:hypothetical protein